MNDLLELNQQVAKRFNLSEAVVKHLGLIGTSLGKMKAGKEDLEKALSTSASNIENLEDFALNRRYLSYARLICQAVRYGEFWPLVSLDISYDTALYLAGLSESQINTLSKNWDGAIVSCDLPSQIAERMNSKQAVVYAGALLAA